MPLQKYKMASLKDKYYEEPNRTNYKDKTPTKEAKVEISKPTAVKKNAKKK